MTRIRLYLDEDSVGDQLRGVLQLVSFKPAEEMQNTVEFLSRWIAQSYRE